MGEGFLRNKFLMNKAIKKKGLSQKPVRIGMKTACQRVGLRVGPKNIFLLFIYFIFRLLFFRFFFCLDFFFVIENKSILF